MKPLFFAVLDGTSSSDPEPVNFSSDPENWACGRIPSESAAKDIHLGTHQLPYSCCNCTITQWPVRLFGARLFPDALGDDFSFFAVTQQQWRACIRRMLHCKLVCILPPSSLDPRSASGDCAVAKEEGRERFIGDRRPHE